MTYAEQLSKAHASDTGINVARGPSNPGLVRCQTGMIDVGGCLMTPKACKSDKRIITTLYDNDEQGKKLIQLIFHAPVDKILFCADEFLLKYGATYNLLVAQKNGEQVEYTIREPIKALVNAMFAAHQDGSLFSARYFVGRKHSIAAPDPTT